MLLVGLASTPSCRNKGQVTVSQVKDGIYGVWIAAPQDAPYVKVDFQRDGTYKLWVSLPFAKSWGNVVLSNTYTIDMETESSGAQFPVVTLNGSAPMNYKILFRGNNPMLWSSAYGEVPIQHNAQNPWKED